MTAGPTSSGTRQRPGRMLVIDDERYLGEALQRTLGDDHQLVVVERASEALGRLESGERYDVVLCDLMMWEMDGIDFHRRLALILPEEAKRVVFITGGVVTARIDAFMRTNGNLLLEKPVDVEGLRSLLDRRIRAAGTQQKAGSL